MEKETPNPVLSLPEEMEFNLSDFALFLSVMKNKDAYESTLSIITDNPKLSLKEVHVEEVVLNKSGKRARFYQGLIDTPVLKSGRQTRYRYLPSSMITFITQEDIFGKDLAQYTFTEQCEEIAGLHLEDGTTKVFLNMSSKNGRPELVSLLQYMKENRLDNPNILVKDQRILKLAEVVEEVKQSEEWEAVKMSILSVGIERGTEIGEIKGITDSIFDFLQDLGPIPEAVTEQILAEKDISRLRIWLKKAARAESIEEFVKEAELTEQRGLKCKI